MTIQAPEISGQGNVDLRAVWQLLTDEEQVEFWKFAGRYARDLKHSNATFKRLCIALREADTAKSGSRPTITVPGSVRALSSDQLQRSIGKVKNRLLDQLNAEPFLIEAFCLWIQQSRLTELNAVLDSVKCLHNERGDLKGTIPDFQPDIAAREICALASTHGAHTLALVCGGLMLNEEPWAGLEAAFEALNQIVSNSSEVDSSQSLAAPAAQVEPDAATSCPKVAPFSSDSLRVILKNLEVLKQHLVDAAVDISAAKIPNLDVAIDCWQQVRKQHSDAEVAIGVCSPFIADLETALLRQSEVALALVDLSRCRSITHVADPFFSGCAIIQAKCDELEKNLDRNILDPDLLRGVAALIRLIEDVEKMNEDVDKLDDKEAVQIQDEVEALFGRLVATAASRGRLYLKGALPNESTKGSATAELPPTLLAEISSRQLTPAPTSPPSFPIAKVDPEPVAPPVVADAETQQSTALECDKANDGPAPNFATNEDVPVSSPIPEPTNPPTAPIEIDEPEPEAPSEQVDAKAQNTNVLRVDKAKELVASSTASNTVATESLPLQTRKNTDDENPDRVELQLDLKEAPSDASASANAVLERQTPDSEFESFESFCRSNWVDVTGSVVPAPWSRDGFCVELAKRALEAWDLGEAAIAYIFARAVCALAGVDPLGIDDLGSTDKILSDPARHSAGSDISRPDRLRASLAGTSRRDIGLALMLEALRPTLPSSFTPPEIEGLLAHAHYNDPAVSEIVHFLMLGWSAQQDPFAALRARLLDAPAETIEVVEADLRTAQAALRAEVTSLWRAAGGRIQRTHCRAAWTKFVRDEVAPFRDELAPIDIKASSRVKWTPDRIRDRVIALGRSFQRIMDSDEVKHRDRNVAEDAAKQIVEAIGKVADALQRLESHRKRIPVFDDGTPHEAGLRLLSGSSSNTTDRFCAILFGAVLQGKTYFNGLRLNAGYLINHVDVIKYLNPNALSRPGIARDGVCVLDLEDPVPASVLLLGWHAKKAHAVDDDDELWVALRNGAADSERLDVLAALSSTNVLQAHERTLLHRYALELGDGAFEVTKDLERLWGACNELMASAEVRLKAVVEEAKSLTTLSSTNGSMARGLLLLSWLKQSVAAATVHRNTAARALLESAREKPQEIAAGVESYFMCGDYRAGMALFHGGAVPSAPSDRLAGRRTLWRDDALKAWPEPRTKLANDLRGSNSDQKRLVEAWTSSNLETGQRESMPRLLYAVISGEAGRTSSENQKRFPVKLPDLREHKDKKTTISCETVRNYFQRSKLNPTFLPQLADFSQIVIVPSPQQASRGGSVLDDWCKAASNEASGSLVVFLAPSLPLSRRDELCSGLRKRGIAAAILDDIDLCRLCAVSAQIDGHDFIPLLEILMEQLDLDRASPFSSLDGQHVRLETYIGRTQEAQNVALRWSYTRVFSGRKLGKSALLKYVASTFDGYQLPSGNTLSVFFITIAGGESERWVVDCIVDEMAARFCLAEKPGQKDQPPAERFSDYMKRFLHEKPLYSVLLILDEADAFVEGQLARYDTDREGSLSFRMMKELPAQVDANQLPRIRTIFSGYRVTNTRGGVWANAGDVLVLRPLAEDEAVQFLQGMLARVGIALGNHAPFVAMRCGFQPAVLIRFGESLVKRLKRSNKSAYRETLIVTHDEVLATLGEQGVLDEIKTVVNNNFQGNRMGAVVFGATLLALKDLEPGLALTQGPAQVLAKLREVDPNLDWLERIDSSPLSEIERNLQDFIDRELLTVSDAPRFGVREYRLRFPHFLPVLTQQSEVALEVRKQIQAIRGGATQRRVSECVLSESSLDTVRFWYHQDSTKDCKLIVVGGHWSDALLDPKCGVPDRLGCERAAISMATKATDLPVHVESGTQVFGKVAMGAWPAFLAANANRPLVLIGGLDLQRTARRYALDGGEVPVEVVTLGRLTEATLAWWFEDARALHFKSSNAIEQIALATGLVPFLADEFSRLLPHVAGSDVSERELKSALSRLDADMSETAIKLCDSTWEGGLSLREIELLQMAVRVAEEGANDFDLESEFPEYWSLLGLSSNGGAPMSDPDDWFSLKLLTEVGLLPVKSGLDTTVNSHSLGRVSFEPSGVLVRLIKALGLKSAA